MRIDNVEINTDFSKVLDAFIEETRARKLNLFNLGYKESGDYLMVQCPYHKFGQERKPSAEFNKNNGLFWCFNCKISKPFTTVLYDKLGVNGRSWLLEHFDGTNIEDRKFTFDLNRDQKNNDFMDKSILDQFRTKHPYMYQRKLNDDVIEKFDVGYDPNFILETKDNQGNVVKRSIIGECITFPVRDEDGNLLFIARRAINQKFFNYPLNVDKPLYGMYEIKQEELHTGKSINEVYVCESILDALVIWRYGKYAIALNGTGSSYQYDLLKKSPFRTLILATDNDDAGRRARQLLHHNVRNKVITEIDYASYGSCKDINDMTEEQFKNAKIVYSL